MVDVSTLCTDGATLKTNNASVDYRDKPSATSDQIVHNLHTVETSRILQSTLQKQLSDGATYTIISFLVSMPESKG